ncbi:hypothetical protein [Streptomyces sp. NPDC089919]|uniref:hypothetical protein n=1 Tax=Streptomyces sp. NPDC089919 TaxID=3155188 RepID=UPI003422D0D9
MHIPAYAHPTIRSAVPVLPTSRHVAALDCCFCDEPFGDRLPVPLGPSSTSGFFGCHSCLRQLVSRARQSRDDAFARSVEQAEEEAAAWRAARGRHLADLDRVRLAADTVVAFAGAGEVEALRMAWLLVSLESAHAWATDYAPAPPPTVQIPDTELKEGRFQLDLAMVSAREAVAERLAYHLINESQPVDPELCAELECPDDCSGRHDDVHIDCGPDQIFEDLAEAGQQLPGHGGLLEQPVARQDGTQP